MRMFHNGIVGNGRDEGQSALRTNDYMFEDINNYKSKINNILTNKQYSKKTPLNTYTSLNLLKHFTFRPYNTYITIHTLKKEYKEAIIREFLEFKKIKDYKNYFDIYFRLDENTIDKVLETIDLYSPESIMIYDVTNLDKVEIAIKKDDSLTNICNYKITINLEEQRFTINYNKNNKSIAKIIKAIKKELEE